MSASWTFGVFFQRITPSWDKTCVGGCAAGWACPSRSASRPPRPWPSSPITAPRNARSMPITVGPFRRVLKVVAILAAASLIAYWIGHQGHMGIAQRLSVPRKTTDVTLVPWARFPGKYDAKSGAPTQQSDRNS